MSGERLGCQTATTNAASCECLLAASRGESTGSPSVTFPQVLGLLSVKATGSRSVPERPWRTNRPNRPAPKMTIRRRPAADSSKACCWRTLAAAGVSRSNDSSCWPGLFIEERIPLSSVVPAGTSFGGARNRRVRRQTPVVDQLRERWDVGIRTVNGVDHDGLIFRHGFQDKFATHQFAAGDLSLLERNGEIDVGILENVAHGKIAF